MSPLDQWISKATKGLSPESAAQVRAEIQQHYDSASEAGVNPIAALGDPRTTNRAYRKVLLTEQEALMASVLTQPKRPSFQRILLNAILLAAFVWLLAGKRSGPGYWPITIAIFSTAPLVWFLPPNTLERSRTYFYVHGVRSIVVVGIAWWYQGWIGAFPLGAVIFLLEYVFSYRRLSIFRKLTAGQTYGPLPGEPQLTHLEAIHLRTLQKGSPFEKTSITFLFLILGAMTFFSPATFLPMTVWMVAGFVAGRTLPIYTEERSRWFRIAKWGTAVVAGMMPVLYGARAPWVGAVYLAFLFWLFDAKSISLRRNLPVARWPKRLYW